MIKSEKGRVSECDDKLINSEKNFLDRAIACVCATKGKRESSSRKTIQCCIDWPNYRNNKEQKNHKFKNEQIGCTENKAVIYTLTIGGSSFALQ